MKNLFEKIKFFFNPTILIGKGENCDVICDGKNDVDVINTVIAVLDKIGGRIIFEPREYNIDKPIKHK